MDSGRTPLGPHRSLRSRGAAATFTRTLCSLLWVILGIEPSRAGCLRKSSVITGRSSRIAMQEYKHHIKPAELLQKTIASQWLNVIRDGEGGRMGGEDVRFMGKEWRVPWRRMQTSRWIGFEAQHIRRKHQPSGRPHEEKFSEKTECLENNA